MHRELLRLVHLLMDKRRVAAEEFKIAVARARLMIEHNPDSAHSYADLAFVYAAMGDDSAADEERARATELGWRSDPDADLFRTPSPPGRSTETWLSSFRRISSLLRGSASRHCCSRRPGRRSCVRLSDRSALFVGDGVGEELLESPQRASSWCLARYRCTRVLAISLSTYVTRRGEVEHVIPIVGFDAVGVL